MKKKINILISFIAVFALTYLFTSFGIPGWRLKLDAPSLKLFIEHLKSMALIKCSASLITGAVAGLLVSKLSK